MVISSLKKLFFVPAVLAILVLASCQKEIDINDPDIIPEEVKDSTLLIKSITLLANRGLPDEDSVTEHYSYDTINKKIILTWYDRSGSWYADGTSAELSYTNKGLLYHVAYKYPLGFTPWDYDYNTIDIVYDPENVLQKITVKYSNGSIESKLFTKAILSGGKYQLSWDESNSGPDDIVLRRAVFDAAGKNIINATEHSFIAETSPAGDNIFTNFITTDSLFYDASGNVSKIVRNEVDTLRHTTDSYIFYEFVRQTKGDQLYNHRQTIMNGIANMPFGDPDAPVEDAFGILSFSLDYEYQQYAKYPIQTAKARMWDGSYKDFTASSDFDNKNRLTKFVWFFHDYDLEPIEYRIRYYK